MFVLKPEMIGTEKEKGNFVDNLRNTIEILTDSCKVIPPTAFKRINNNKNSNLPPVRIPRAKHYSSDVPGSSVTHSKASLVVLEFEEEFGADDFVLLDEPVAMKEFSK
jgi:hypothetical protein